MFDISWEGFSDSRNIDLEASVTFSGIEASGSESDTDEAILERLLQVLDAEDYIQQPMKVRDFKYGTGLRLAQSHFEPRLK